MDKEPGELLVIQKYFMIYKRYVLENEPVLELTQLSPVVGDVPVVVGRHDNGDVVGTGGPVIGLYVREITLGMSDARIAGLPPCAVVGKIYSASGEPNEGIHVPYNLRVVLELWKVNLLYASLRDSKYYFSGAFGHFFVTQLEWTKNLVNS